VKTLIEIHALQNYAPSNLNRDDTGAPKDALFGGTRRARISSQCLKRAIRQYFGAMAAEGTLSPEDLASRTKRVMEPLAQALVAKGHPLEEAKARCGLALATIGLPLKEDGKNQYLLFLGRREIAAMAEVIDSNWDAIIAPETDPEEKKSAKARKQAPKESNKSLKDALEKALDGGKALDVALFGRMLADMPQKNQDAACQVAHAISTHAAEREFDYYTAVDDLKPDDMAGADMIGTIEFNSACFYRYALVDWDRLMAGLKDEDLAIRGLRAFLEGFVLAEPTGKQNSFAAHNPPEFIAICVRHHTAPRNLANAFEAAVRPRKGESITRISAQKLVEKAKRLKAAYGGTESTFVLDLVDAGVEGFASPTESLEDLLARTLAAVKE
jgi:CRISPR system Cascade subunit CasC